MKFRNLCLHFFSSTQFWLSSLPLVFQGWRWWWVKFLSLFYPWSKFPKLEILKGVGELNFFPFSIPGQMMWNFFLCWIQILVPSTILIGLEPIVSWSSQPMQSRHLWRKTWSNKLQNLQHYFKRWRRAWAREEAQGCRLLQRQRLFQLDRRASSRRTWWPASRGSPWSKSRTLQQLPGESTLGFVTSY